MLRLFMNDVFIKYEFTSGFRGVNLLVQYKLKTTTYGHKYQQSKFWSNLLNDYKNLFCLSSFKCEIQNWYVPDCHSGYCLQCSLSCM